MNYESSIAYLEGLQQFGIQLGLKRVIRLLELMGNPHKNLKYIHVAGTNGKGSTVAFLASILKHSGYRVGVYTSPHLIRFNERITLNETASLANNQIPDKDIARLTGQISGHIESSGLQVTYFEATTVLAFAYFAEKKPDFVILEVGLGGRLDATNVIIPQVSIITNISLEHTAVLGNTIEEIATEKAGIIKQGIPVVCGVMDEKALLTIKNIAEERSAPFYVVAEEEGDKTSDTKPSDCKPIQLSLMGAHQLQNAACAVLAARILAEQGININQAEIPNALSSTHWPGRLQVIGQKPLMVVDGAHNPAGAKVLRQAIDECFTYDQLILVLGILDDKDQTAMLGELIADNQRLKLLILTKPETSRAFPPDKLLEEANKYRVPAMVCDDIPTAITQTIKAANDNDMICLAGSLYVVAEVLLWFSNSNCSITCGCCKPQLTTGKRLQGKEPQRV
ncbi:bifunctional folylpolyglutamate synthase/dihydrofolate synthase [bacterium]|nr:bifunctional folylpolyglutamate synthase/dihydrofolate synthase [bacterium]MBU1752730.1 bifunctional folylpolyglutamate synthase/dihydrofolate synthase [bacterium]